MTDELVRPKMAEIPHVMAVLNTALASWEAVDEVLGRDVAGDPVKEMATALVLAGYQRVTVTEVDRG